MLILLTIVGAVLALFVIFAIVFTLVGLRRRKAAGRPSMSHDDSDPSI